MINLMLYAGGQDTLRRDFKFFAVGFLRSDVNRSWTRNSFVEARHREAAFVVGGQFALQNPKLWINKYLRAVSIFRYINYQQPFVYVHLSSGKPYSLCFVHGLKHIFDQDLQIGVEDSNGFRYFSLVWGREIPGICKIDIVSKACGNGVMCSR